MFCFWIYLILYNFGVHKPMQVGIFICGWVKTYGHHRTAGTNVHEHQLFRCDNMGILWGFGLYPVEQGITMIPIIWVARFWLVQDGDSLVDE